jgi:hypothetical protein
MTEQLLCAVVVFTLSLHQIHCDIGNGTAVFLQISSEGTPGILGTPPNDTNTNVNLDDTNTNNDVNKIKKENNTHRSTTAPPVIHTPTLTPRWPTRIPMPIPPLPPTTAPEPSGIEIHPEAAVETAPNLSLRPLS